MGREVIFRQVDFAGFGFTQRLKCDECDECDKCDECDECDKCDECDEFFRYIFPEKTTIPLIRQI